MDFLIIKDKHDFHSCNKKIIFIMNFLKLKSIGLNFEEIDIKEFLEKLYY